MSRPKHERTPFADELLTHARRWKAASEGRDGLASPMYSDWLDGIFPSLRDDAARVVDAEGVRLHDYARAVVSSQAFAFNLFLPFRVAAASALADLLSRAAGRQIQVDGVRFEYVPEGDILGEWRGATPADDEARTAVDVWLDVSDSGANRGVVLLEVKLSEGGFTPCGGLSSRGNRDHGPCESAAVLLAEPKRCYLTHPYRATQDRRQWTILAEESEEKSLAGTFPGVSSGAACPFAGDGNQIMRNHALGAGMVQAGRAAFFAFGLVHHDDNQHVIAPWDGYVALLGDRRSFFRLPASQVIDVLAANNGWGEWAAYMRARYRIGAADVRPSGQYRSSFG